MGQLQPPRTLETVRSFLRPVSVDDAQAIFDSYASSPVATRFMNFPRQQIPAEAVQFAMRCARCWEDRTAFPWAVVSKAGGDFMGIVELRLDPPKADFGYVFAERFWGHGLGTEAARAVVDWACAQPEIYRVWATCHPQNTRSARVLEKLGLALEARLENWEARPQLGEAAGPSLVFAKVLSR
ncbi:GNAT family protein [Pigmentiphaga soli]|uniref:GNAT family protein n=1 Tax=Pigmentiphaga soli TaxID=1007095 RepID=A0ABP8H5L8_9BURK